MPATAVWSHRGNVDVEAAPKENSLDAFNLASANGIDGIETDTWITADHEFVVTHDRDTPFGRIDALCRRQVPHLSSLAEAVAVAQVASLNIELKVAPAVTRDVARGIGSELAAALEDIVVEPGRQLVVSSFSKDATDGVLAVASTRLVGHLCESHPTLEGLRELVDTGYWSVHTRVGALDRGAADACHNAGLKLVAWTVNDLLVADSLSRDDVDVLITDRPLAVRASLSRVD